MNHAFYIIAAYAVTGLGISGLWLISILRRRHVVRMLAQLARQEHHS